MSAEFFRKSRRLKPLDPTFLLDFFCFIDLSQAGLPRAGELGDL
jgi:hypothetical protein